MADLHQQMTLAEVARDASREAYDAEHDAHEATKRELDDARNVLRLLLTVERSSAISLAQGHFSRYGGSK